MIIYIMQGIRQNTIGIKPSICFAGANMLQHINPDTDVVLWYAVQV